VADAQPGTRVRKRPLRSCVACRLVRDKRDLIRIVRTPDDTFCLDPSGKANGRGAYICATVECWKQAIRRKSLTRALKLEIPPETLAELEQGFLAALEKA
jgi:predicted RNA-binding protein YlxR (DUF448 family)